MTWPIQLQAFVEHYQPQLEEVMEQALLKLKPAVAPQLWDSMHYSLMAGGKRLRPLLYLAAKHDVTQQVTADDFMVAASLEAIHTYSLIHDDLPAMDNDDLRRGQPTNHKVFGEAVAILAGDGLLTLAFSWLNQAQHYESCLPKLTLILAQAAGPEGMVSGQTLDIVHEGEVLSLAQLQQLDLGKTGALLVAPLKLAAVTTQSSEAVQRALVLFGEQFGLNFQIWDDILDLTSSTDKLGKTAHKDVSQGKNTYPALLGLAASYQAVATNCQVARQALAGTNMPFPLLSGFLNYFEHQEEN